MKNLNFGTPEKPLELKTPPGSSIFFVYRDFKYDTEVIACVVRKTSLYYDIQCIWDLQEMLLEYGDWMELGSKDEKQDAKPNTIEYWGRSSENPVGGWYGLRKGFRGRFGMYIPPLMEYLGLAELTHEKRGNKMRAIPNK
ncbi:MAG: DUF6855 family protein [Bacteroidota bacterium]